MIKKISQENRIIAFVDEVGRGCLAGPVVACAVMLTAHAKLKVKSQKLKVVRLGDSKKLTAKQREYLFEIFTKLPYIKWAVASVYPKVIDHINILEATRLAAKRAVYKLRVKPDLVITDGNFKLRIRIPQVSVVKADEKFLPCSIASIIAKVTRDRLMKRMAKRFPHYGFEKHKGYGTSKHYDALRKYGPSPIHRRSFRLA